MMFGRLVGARHGSPCGQEVYGRNEKKEKQAIQEALDNESCKVGWKNFNARHREEEAQDDTEWPPLVG